ncbi:MAG: 23S rRNA (guanosine(2251)-2'-O)-methyltransferase RlmB [Candidatus Geothermincolia bacterium]
MKYEQVEGKNSVVEALRSGKGIFEILVQSGMREDMRLNEIVKEARARRIQVSFLPKAEMDKLSLVQRHQGVIARTEAFRYASLKSLLEEPFKRQEEAFLVLLDGITDPHNLGSIIRSAEAAGAHGLVLPKHRSAPMTPVVFHTAAGAAEYLKVATVPNLVSAAQHLKEEGLWIIGADERAESDIFAADLTGPIALVLGAEGRGLSRLMRENCDSLVRIPMRGKVQSLNVGVAAGVLLYEILRRRSV